MPLQTSAAGVGITPQTNRPLRMFVLIAGIVTAVSASLYFMFTWHWPLVGDASLIHYICFLMDHGMAPYRDLGDMNMPGSFLLEWAVMHTIGSGAFAWRIYDFALMAAATAAIMSIARPYGRFPGLFASAIFILVHGRDGFVQAGQRDLAMAVALLAATAFLFRALRQNEIWPAALFGFFAGFSLTIKPTSLLFAFGLLGIAVLHRRIRRQSMHLIGAASLGLLVGPAIAVAFLWRERALAAFIHGLQTVVPYYASLGHRPFVYLLNHSVSPLMPLIVVWLLLLAIGRPRFTWERTALLAGIIFGLASYLVQARGLPYYRYPLLAFLLPLIAIDLTISLDINSSKIQRIVAIAGIALGAFLIAPRSAGLILQYDWHNLDFITSLEESLSRLGGPALSGHIQCIDSISGCGTTLYRMKLVQETGVLSDFLLFGPADKPVIRETREELTHAIQQKPPLVIVVSSFLHIDGPDGYGKLSRWPEFQDDLSSRYCKAVDWMPTRPQKWWSRAQWPNGYRIYVLRGSQVAKNLPTTQCQ